MNPQTIGRRRDPEAREGRHTEILYLEEVSVATISRRSVTLMLTLAILTLPGAVLRAQAVPDLRNSSYVGLGYVASIPDMFVGGTALFLSPEIFGGAGLYADVRLTPSSPGGDPYFRSDISVDQAELAFGDRLFQEKSVWLSVDLAVVYVLAREFAVYAGAGYLRERKYREYFDDSLTRGFDGFYWVLDDAESRTRVNVLGGAFFRVSRYVFFQMGLEARPGANVGITLALPI